MGMAVHQDSIAVASVAQDHGAEVIDLGAIGTRPWAIEPLRRTRPSHAPPIFVYDAGPWGDWLDRYLTHTGDDCGVVAPALRPQKAGARVQTDRRAAVPLARLARAGDLPAVYGPPVEAEAMRALTRARDDASRALNDATFRLQALWLRQAIRGVGRAHGAPAHLRWRAAVVGPHTGAAPRRARRCLGGA